MEYNFNRYNLSTVNMTLNSNFFQYTDHRKKLDVQINYSDIEKIQLYSSEKGVYECKIIDKKGNRFFLRSRTATKLGDFVDKSKEYKTFIKELHNRTKNFMHIKYIMGNSAFYFYLILLMLLGIGYFLIILISIKSNSHLFKPSFIIGPLLFLPIATHILKTGMKKKYRVEDLPEKYLP